jgi:hypothetical protein
MFILNKPSLRKTITIVEDYFGKTKNGITWLNGKWRVGLKAKIPWELNI